MLPFPVKLKSEKFNVPSCKKNHFSAICLKTLAQDFLPKKHSTQASFLKLKLSQLHALIFGNTWKNSF